MSATSILEDDLFGDILRAVLVAGWAALLLGLGLALLQEQPGFLDARLPDIDERVLEVVGMLLIGLASGALAGMRLYGRMGALRFLVACVAIVIGLMGALLMRGFLNNIPILKALRRPDDLFEAAKLAVAGLGGLVGIRTGRIRVKVKNKKKKKIRTVTAAAEPTVEPSTERRVVQLEPRQATSAATGPRIGIAPRARKAAPKPKRKRRKLLRRSTSMNLSKDVTSVCPYCFEEVAPGDPRGQVVCKVCDTVHHKDCWEVTGACQVPHLQ